MKKPFPAAIPILFILGSCIYAPEEEYFKEIGQTLPEATIDLNSYNETDTIVLYTPMDFQFNVSASRGFHLATRVRLDDVILYDGNQSAGVFSISDQNLKTGLYELTVEFVNTSGTGSYLDKLGGEFVEIWRTWMVKIDVDPPPAPVVTLGIEQGYLKVSWTAFSKANFTQYQLVANGHAFQRIVHVTDPLATSWIDSAYIGGSAYYSVSVSTPLHTSSGEASINDQQEFNVAYEASDTTALLQWRKTKYYGAFGEFVVSENDVVRSVITAAADTTLQLKLKDVIMGGTSWLDFEMKRKYDGMTIFSERVFLDNPLQLPRLTDYPTFYPTATHGLIGYAPGYFNGICTYNTALEKMGCNTTIVPSQLSIPYHGDYAYYPSGSTMIQANLVTDEKRSFVITNSPSFTLFGSISAGDGQIVYYSYIDNQYPWDRRFHQVIVDMGTNSIIYETETEYDEKGGLYYNFLLSHDGRFAYHPNGANFYKIGNGTVEPHFGFNFSLGVFRAFRPDADHQGLFTSGNTVNVVDLEDQTILKTLSPGVEGYVFKNYDPVSKYLLFVKSGSRAVYLVHAESDEVIAVGALGDTYRLVSGHLVSDSGYYVKVADPDPND